MMVRLCSDRNPFLSISFLVPRWPGMIEPDPDLGEYFLFASHLDSLPVSFLVLVLAAA